MPDCVVKSGESIEPQDPRLSDTACSIEPGVIIRLPPDLTVAVEPPKPKPVVVAPRPVPVAPIPQKMEEPAQVMVAEQPAKKIAIVSVPDAPDPLPVPVDESQGFSPTTIAIAAVGAVAVAGAAAAGGFSTVQAKIASLLGTSKAAAAGGAVVAVGTVVAVKAIESKMKNLEKDLEKTKKQVGDASSSIDRIDALLDKLGS